MRLSLLDEAVAELAAEQHGAFALAQLREYGATPALAAKRVRARRWEPLRRGVYALSYLVDDWTVAAGSCLSAPHVVLGWSTAAHRWRFDGVDDVRVEGAVAPHQSARQRLLRRLIR